MLALTALGDLLRSRRGTLLSLLFLVALVFAIGAYSLCRHGQLAFMGGLAEEYLHLAVNLNAHGTLGFRNEAFFLRPPGYPWFLALSLRLAGLFGDPSFVASHLVQVAAWAQCLVLLIGTGVFLLWTTPFLGRTIAFFATTALAANPYVLALVGLMHYEILHLVLLVCACYALDHVLAVHEESPVRMLAVGLLWGIATLVRPLTLALPPFVLIALALRGRRLGTVARQWAAFCLGMGLAILPWTVRNYAVSGAVIPVNAQTWAAIWGSTVRAPITDPNQYGWHSIARPSFLPVYMRATGRASYDLIYYLRYNLDLEAAFKREAIANIRSRPGVYVRNCVANFLSLNFDVSTMVLREFESVSQPGTSVTSLWFTPGHSADGLPSRCAGRFLGFVRILTILAAGGIVLALLRGDRRLLVAAAAYLCLCLAHTFTFMDLMYYYVKFPFLFLFAFYGLTLRHSLVGRIASGLLGLAALWMTIGVL